MNEANEVKKVKIPSHVTVKKFGELLNVPVSRVITELMKNKILATINEEIDFETASIIAAELGFESEEDLEVSDATSMTLEKLIEICKKERTAGENLQARPPVVTILGHVDHGKTTLLDTLRKTNVAAGEAGGITQHISAYQVKKRGQLITFIDTPGHEAFSAMRERGVSIADVAVLVVAADDGVRPQTKEVIEYLKEKKIPTVVAINKIDKPEANAMRVKQELADHGILIEEWGGQVMASEISAKKNIGIDKLLESILLTAEVEDFKSDYKRDGLAVVLEAHLDPQKGPIATVLVKTGTLKTGQDIIAGATFGRIRKMENYAGSPVTAATPSTPVTIIGLNDTPNTNDIVQVASGKSAARNLSKEMAEKITGKKFEQSKQRMIDSGEESKKILNIVVKSDVQGSLEAIQQILSTINSDEVGIEYIELGVGNITESDVKIAASAHAMIYGFSVILTPVAKRLAEGSGVEIKTYSIIYELVEDVKKTLSAMLPPEVIRTELGRMNVLAIFKTGKHDMIVGGRVNEGKMYKKSEAEIKRGDEIIGKGKISNLQQNKQPAEEVGKGNECGITFEGNTRIKEGDIVIAFKVEEKRRTL